MSTIRDNGAQVPVNSDGWNLCPDLATFADSLNVATVCSNQAAMDALVKRNGRLAIRVDLSYALYRCDGANWLPVPLATPYGHMGRTAGFQALSTTTATVVMDAAQDLRGGMTFDNANDALVIPISGLYRLNVKLYTSGAASAVKHVATVNKVASGLAISGATINVFKADTADWLGYASLTVNLSANDKLFLSAAVISGTSNTWGTDGYNGTFLEAEYIRP